MILPTPTPPATLVDAQRQLDQLWAMVNTQQAALQAQQAALQAKDGELQAKDSELLVKQNELSDKTEEISQLQAKLHLMLLKRFGASSEKASALGQLNLFDEAEQLAESDSENVESDEQTETVTYQRKKAGRKGIPDHLPRVRIVHELSESETVCDCGGQRHVMGEETSEQLDLIPAQVQVLVHVRKKYACRACESGIKTAPLPPQPLPKSKASPGLLAFIIAAKFADALPLYRQATILKRHGISLPRQTLANWVIGCGQLIQPLLNLMQDDLLAGNVINMDETPVQVLKEEGRAPQTKSYMWVRVGGTEQQRVILYHYAPSRGGAVVEELLEEFKGYLQTDGYAAYAETTRKTGVFAQGCMAHARRYFVDVQKVGKGSAGKKSKPGKASIALSAIGKLYALERKIKDKPPDERYQVRQKEAIPVLRKLREWLDQTLGTVPPKGVLGTALSYLNNHWESLCRYTENGYLSIDNNCAENAIRPFVIGRKNWLFSNTPRGATASAALYSLIETAKANGLEPYHYLKYVLAHLPAAQNVEQVEALLPWNLRPEMIS